MPPIIPPIAGPTIECFWDDTGVGSTAGDTIGMDAGVVEVGTAVCKIELMTIVEVNDAVVSASMLT